MHTSEQACMYFSRYDGKINLRDETLLTNLINLCVIVAMEDMRWLYKSK